MSPNYLVRIGRATVFVLLFCLSLAGCSAKHTATSGQTSNLSSKYPEKQLSEVDSRMRKKDYSAALRLIERLISENDELPNFHLLKAKILVRMGKKQEALDYLTDQIERHPNEASFVAARGQALLELGFLESARDDFYEAYQRDYRTFDVLKVLADIAQNSGKLKEALDIIKEALLIEDDDHLLWYKKARLELRLFRISESQASILKAIEIKNDVITYHQFYVEILMLLKKKNEIEAHINKIYSKFPDNSWVAMQLAAIAVAKGKIDDAKAILQRVLKDNPKDYLMIFQLATIFAAEKKWNISVEYFKRGLEIKPSSTWAKIQLSKIYLQIGKVDDAIQMLKEARSEETQDLFVYQTLAQIYNRQNDTFEAERIILEGLSINDKYLPLILEYANILEKRGNYSEVIVAYEEALRLDKSNHIIIGKLANYYRLTKDYQKALAYFKKALALKPSESWLRAYFVELLVEQEKWREALRELKSIEELTPDDYWVHAKKAVILDELENYNEALQSITRAIALKPEAVWLKEIEGQVLENLGKYQLAADAFKASLGTAPDSSYLLTRLGYVQMMFNREAALKSVNAAMDSDDFDISTIELYLYLKGLVPQTWGFSANSKEFLTYQKIIRKEFKEAKELIKLLKRKSSPHAPFLSFFLKHLERSKNNIIKLSESEINSLKSKWHYFYLGVQAQSKNDSELAKSYLQKALRLDPKNKWIMVKLAFTHQALGEHKQAIELLKKYIASRSESLKVWALLRLALNYDLAQQYSDAERIYKKILAGDPNDNIALNNLAWMYLTTKNPKMQKTDEALRLAQKAVELSPSAANLDTLANAYYQKKDYNRALKTIERALDRDRQSLDDFKKTKKKILKAIQSDSQ